MQLSINLCILMHQSMRNIAHELGGHSFDAVNVRRCQFVVSEDFTYREEEINAIFESHRSVVALEARYCEGAECRVSICRMPSSTAARETVCYACMVHGAHGSGLRTCFVMCVVR